jgi:hypothetical protein
MTETHSITPPKELLKQRYAVGNLGNWRNALTLAYRAGADQELEACCQWLPKLPPWSGNDLRKHRRPKPPNDKELALLALAHLDKGAQPQMDTTEAVYTIRRALEGLND